MFNSYATKWYLNFYHILLYYIISYTFKSITVPIHANPMIVSPMLILLMCSNTVRYIFSRFPPPPWTPIKSFTWEVMTRMAEADVNPEHTGTDIKLTMIPKPAKLISVWMTPVKKHNNVAYAGPRFPIVLLIKSATMAVGPIGTTLLVPNSK